MEKWAIDTGCRFGQETPETKKRRDRGYRKLGNKRMDIHEDEETNKDDVDRRMQEELAQELEEDFEGRGKSTCTREKRGFRRCDSNNQNALANETDDEDDEDDEIPEIKLEEMLDDMKLSDVEEEEEGLVRLLIIVYGTRFQFMCIEFSFVLPSSCSFRVLRHILRLPRVVSIQIHLPHRNILLQICNRLPPRLSILDLQTTSSRVP